MFDASVDAAARKFGIDSLKKQQVSAIKVTLCGNSVLFWQVSYLPATSLQVNDRKSICLLGIRIVYMGVRHVRAACLTNNNLLLCFIL